MRAAVYASLSLISLTADIETTELIITDIVKGAVMDLHLLAGRMDTTSNVGRNPLGRSRDQLDDHSSANPA